VGLAGEAAVRSRPGGLRRVDGPRWVTPQGCGSGEAGGAAKGAAGRAADGTTASENINIKVPE
jgi:hypothetical protein